MNRIKAIISYDKLRKLVDENPEGLRELQRDISLLLRGKSLSELHVGAVVYFNSHTRPQYLQGREAVVLKVNQKRAKVRLKNPCGRFSTAPINAPFSILSTSKG